MIHQRTPDVAMTKVPLMDVSRNSEKRQPSWNARACGGNPVGRNFATGSDRHRTTHVTLANGRTVGNIVSDTHYRRISKLTCRPASRRAHLRSHSGHNAGIGTRVHCSSTLLPVTVAGAAGPLPVTEARCSGCHEPLDLQGHQLAACPRTGRLKKRATPTERMLAPRFSLPCFGGAKLAVDITLRSVLGSSGEPQPHAADVDGAVLLTARRDKEATYPELATSTRCRLVVVAIETGGRWIYLAVGAGQGPRGSPVPDSAGGPRLGTPLDPNAEHSVRLVLRRVIG